MTRVRAAAQRGAWRRIHALGGEDELFVTIIGKNHDAHKFTAETIGRRSRRRFLVSQELRRRWWRWRRAKEVATILVDDTIAALNRLAGAYRAGMGDLSGMQGAGDCGGGIEWEDDDEADHSYAYDDQEQFGAGGAHASRRVLTTILGCR